MGGGRKLLGLVDKSQLSILGPKCFRPRTVTRLNQERKNIAQVSGRGIVTSHRGSVVRLSSPFGERKEKSNRNKALLEQYAAGFSTKSSGDGKEDKENGKKQETSASSSSAMPEALPGIAAAVGVQALGFTAADHLGGLLMQAQGIEGAASPISGIPVAILLGVLIKNTLPVPKAIEPGLKIASKTFLQVGIVLVGFKLSALDLVQTGLVGIPAVCASIGAGLTFIPWFGNKMGLPHKMSSLIAAGTSICGVTAITALSPAIKASERDTGFAVANVVAFGTVGMLTYPYLAHAMMSNSHQIGMFLGLAVHDTSQVLGSALTYSNVYGDEEVLKVASVTKLTRNLFLAGVIPGLTYMTAKREELEKAASSSSSSSSSSLEKKDSSFLPSFDQVKQHFPAFVGAFVGMSVLRTLGDVSIDSYGHILGVAGPEEWKSLTKQLGTVSSTTLGVAMAAVGLGTSASALKGVGPKPFVVGLAGASVVGGTGLVTTTILTHLFL